MRAPTVSGSSSDRAGDGPSQSRGWQGFGGSAAGRLQIQGISVVGVVRRGGSSQSRLHECSPGYSGAPSSSADGSSAVAFGEMPGVGLAIPQQLPLSVIKTRPLVRSRPWSKPESTLRRLRPDVPVVKTADTRESEASDGF